MTKRKWTLTWRCAIFWRNKLGFEQTPNLWPHSSYVHIDLFSRRGVSCQNHALSNGDVPCFMLVLGRVMHHFKDKQSPCKTTIEGFAVSRKVISFHYLHLSQGLNVWYIYLIWLPWRCRWKKDHNISSSNRTWSSSWWLGATWIFINQPIGNI